MNVEELRDKLLTGIEDFERGKLSAAHLHVLTKAAGKVLMSIGMQLAHANMTGTVPVIQFMDTTERPAIETYCMPPLPTDGWARRGRRPT